MIPRWQVNLSLAPIDQGDVHFHKEVEPGKSAAAQPGLGPYVPGDGGPYVALLLGERTPTGGDRSEDSADTGLSGGAGVKRDKGGIGVLAKPIALPDCIPAFA